MRNLWVVSLGGSRIVPDDVDEKFIQEFKKLICSHSDKKFVVVTGGGSTARRYIKAMRNFGESVEEQSKIGISITRLHAEFLARVFGESANPSEKLPMNMKKVKNLLKKNQIVFCGALRWEKDKTSDGTAAELANYLKCEFINFTNVDGLYTSDPRKNKNAKKISEISWKDFYNIAKKIKFKAGQNFILDQDAAETIMKNKIPVYITNKLSEIDKILNKKNFNGTLIEG